MLHDPTFKWQHLSNPISAHPNDHNKQKGDGPELAGSQRSPKKSNFILLLDQIEEDEGVERREREV